jgi:hypothetical protein
MSRMEYSSNTLQVLLTKESTTYRTNDYLKNSSEADPDETSSSSAAGSSGMKDETDSLDSEIMDEDGPCRHEAKKRKLKNGGLSYPANSITATGMDEAARRQLWREKLCEWAYQGENLPQVCLFFASMNHSHRYSICFLDNSR